VCKQIYHPGGVGNFVGLEIDITRIQCKFKLSQNRSRQDQDQVVKQLKLRGSDQLAKAMEDAG
jgi:transcriptional regulator